MTVSPFIRYLRDVISDDEARRIVEDLRQGIGGTVLRTYVEALLCDRAERVSELADLRARVERAFHYLDRLGDAPPPGPDARAGRAPRRISRRRRPLTDGL